MIKQLERLGGVPDTEDRPLSNDDAGMQKVLEAKALLKRIEDRKMREAEELERRRLQEVSEIVKALHKGPKGGYCGCL